MLELFVPHPRLARFNDANEPSVCPLLIDAAAACFQAWAAHRGLTPFDETRGAVQDRLLFDSWPKTMDQELSTHHDGVRMGQAKANFTYWNPIDGTSWDLYLTLWAGTGKPIHIQSRSNLSPLGFQVQCPQELAHQLPALKQLLRTF
jgi:hypothetical protein